MQRKKIITIAFILLTIVNVIIFILKDSFQFQPYKTYEYLYAPCDKDCSEQWREFAQSYPETELTEARRILDSFHISDSHFTFTKLMRIGNFLYSRFYKQAGTPSQHLLGLSPLLQYKQLCASSKEELWCGNYAAMFCFFCWSDGIVCRTIEIMNPQDHHVVNECYLPETNEWVLVDLTTNMLLVKNNKNQLLNLQSFKNALTGPQAVFAIRSKIDSFGVETVADTSCAIRTYYKTNVPLYYYHSIDTKKAYSPANKLKRYFIPVSWYDIFDTKKHSNFLFYVKDVFALLWLFSFFIFIGSRRKLKS